MNTHSSGSDFHQRLAALEDRFLHILKRLASLGPTPEHHQVTIDEIEGKKTSLRERLAKKEAHEEGTAATHGEGEIEKDLEALTHSVERWAEHVDDEFRRDR